MYVHVTQIIMIDYVLLWNLLLGTYSTLVSVCGVGGENSVAQMPLEGFILCSFSQDREHRFIILLQRSSKMK